MSVDLASDSKKIILVELDIGQQQTIWFCWSAFTFYVDFDAVYDLIDPSFLVGVDPQSITEVGSTSCDAAALRLVTSVAAVEAEETTFFWDPASRRVYIHLIGGDRPSLHRLVLGVVYGASNFPGVYGGMLYKYGLKGVPTISMSRDPLFWGRIEIGGGTITIDNADGALDWIAEDQDIFGNSARTFLGFDQELRSDFRQLYTGTIGTVRIGTETVEVTIEDARGYLDARVPDKQFLQADYPDLKDSNEGKGIPIGYGVLRNVPAMCTNEAEAPAPANYSFKLFDMSHHAAIHAITTVYVEGVAKATSATDLAAATFSLAAANYSPGQKVTVVCEGYEDDSGNLIKNGLDIISDLIAQWIGIPYSASAYDQTAWAAARLLAPDACYFADKPMEISKIIEDLCTTVQGLFRKDRFGRFTFRMPASAGYPMQFIESWESLDGAPAIEYSPTETIGVILVGYSKDWDSGDFLWLRDDSRQADVLQRYKLAPERTFDTLLTTAAAAQAFATAVLDQAERVERKFPLRLKLQDSQRELGDPIQVTLRRRAGTGFLGKVKAEVIGVDYALLAAEQKLACRIVELIGDTIYVEAGFYDDMFYGDDFYGRTGEVPA